MNSIYYKICRNVWDSYLDEKRGSPIPQGWVLPTESQNAWAQTLPYVNIIRQ